VGGFFLFVATAAESCTSRPVPGRGIGLKSKADEKSFLKINPFSLPPKGKA